MKRVYIPSIPSNPLRAIPPGAIATLNRLGVAYTSNPDYAGITHVMPLRDEDAQDCVTYAADHKLPYMTQVAYDMVFDKFNQQELTTRFNLPTLSTIIPTSPFQVRAFATGAVILKLRKSYNYPVNVAKFAYRVFPNVSLLLAQIPDSFWIAQASAGPNDAQYVLQNASYTDDCVPVKVINFVVNGKSECLFSRITDLTFRASGKILTTIEAAPDMGGVLPSTLEAIRRTIKGLGIKNVAHSVQFIRFNGADCLIDWNLRPGISFFFLTPQDNPMLADMYYAHMFDEPYAPLGLNGYLRVRIYQQPADKIEALLTDLELKSLRTPRLDPRLTAWIYGRHNDLSVLRERFAELETRLAL